MSGEPTNEEPGIAYMICWRLSDPHIVYTMNKGACVTGKCIDCGEFVLASLQGINDIIEKGYEPVPLCKECALRPDWREKLAPAEIIHGPALDRRSVDAFIATLRATPEGHGLN